MTDAQKIAEGLSGAMRKAVLHAFDPNWNRDGTTARLKADGRWQTTNALFDLGVTDADEFLTPLGLEVRALLQEKAGG